MRYRPSSGREGTVGALSAGGGAEPGSSSPPTEMTVTGSGSTRFGLLTVQTCPSGRRADGPIGPW